MDDLSISAAINGIQPDRGILEVIPAADGSLKAELSYTAATKSLNGSDLNPNSTQDVYFYINGEQTPANRTYKAYPGQKVAITVEVHGVGRPHFLQGCFRWHQSPRLSGPGQNLAERDTALRPRADDVGGPDDRL